MPKRISTQTRAGPYERDITGKRERKENEKEKNKEKNTTPQSHYSKQDTGENRKAPGAVRRLDRHEYGSRARQESGVVLQFDIFVPCLLALLVRPLPFRPLLCAQLFYRFTAFTWL